MVRIRGTSEKPRLSSSKALWLVLTIILARPLRVMADAVPQQTFASIEARTAFAGNSFSGNSSFIFYGESGKRQHYCPSPVRCQRSDWVCRQHIDIGTESRKGRYVSLRRSRITLKQLLRCSTACLRSLGFSGMRSRQQDIAFAEPDTCDWLFDTHESRAWRDPNRLHTHHGVLWLKGKPGVGKSTLMKHALHRYQDDLFEGYLVVAYFFNARGGKLERSPLGFLRSIVHQLIEHSDELYEIFTSLFRQKKMLSSGTDMQWRLSELQDFIRSLVRRRACSRPLLLVVDALDECDESDVRDVVSLLESLAVQAAQTGYRLRICLSSRHYPTIRMAKCVELVVEKNSAHQADIETYIRERLRTPDLHIQAQIAQRADGIFL